MGYDFLIK